MSRKLTHRTASQRWSAGHRSVTRGNLGCNWRKKTHRRPADHRWDAVRRPNGDLPANLDMESHLTVTARPPAGVRQITARSPLDHRRIVNLISCDSDWWCWVLPTDWLKNISSTPQDSQRWPRDHRRDIGGTSDGGRTVSWRRPSDDHWVSLRLCFKVKKIGRWAADAWK